MTLGGLLSDISGFSKHSKVYIEEEYNNYYLIIIDAETGYYNKTRIPKK